MSEQGFQHRQAALALLSECPDKLAHKAAGFLGHCCIALELTPAQREWLDKLMDRNGFEPLPD